MAGKRVEKAKSERSEKGAKKKKIAPLLLIVMVVLILVLMILVFFLLVQTGFIKNPLTNLHFSTQEFQIEDECTMIVGNLIHSIQDEGVCEQKCKTECGVRALYFYSSTFIEREGDCHLCSCFCR